MSQVGVVLVTTKIWAAWSGLQISVGLRYFIFPKMSIPALGSTQFSIRWVKELFFRLGQLQSRWCLYYWQLGEHVHMSFNPAILLLLPLALQLAVFFGLLNIVLPFFPICHQLSPSSHSQHLKTSIYFLFPSFPGPSPPPRPFQFLSEDLWVSYPPPVSPGDLTNLSFVVLSILLHVLLCSSLLVLGSSTLQLLI